MAGPYASSGAMLYAYNLSFEETEAQDEKLSYSFTVDETDLYDIWYLGSGTNRMATHLSGMYWDVDEPPEKDTKYRNDVPQDSAPTIMNSPGAVSTIPIYWQKMGTRELEAGGHTLELIYEYRALAGSDPKMIVWGDCVVVVPASWNWTPPADGNAADRYPDYSAARLDLYWLEQTYFCEDLSSVSQNIPLPGPGVVGSAGTVFAFASNRPEIISADGRVTRPYYNENDADVIFSITANRGNGTVSKDLPITVLKLPKYHCTDVQITKADDSTYRATADIALNADAASDLTGACVFVLAAYDPDGALVGIGAKTQTVTGRLESICTELQIQADQVVEVKAYIISDWGTLQKVAESAYRQEEL